MFALWDVIGEAGYREMLRERGRLPLSQRYAWPDASRGHINGDEECAHARVRPADVGRWAVLELLLTLYADLNTGSMSARTRLIVATVALLGLGAGAGTGIAAILGRSVETGLATGVIVSGVLGIGYLLLMISLVAAEGLMALARTGHEAGDRRAEALTAESDRDHPLGRCCVRRHRVRLRSGHPRHDVVPGTPFSGPMEQTTGTVLSWDDGHRYRSFQLQYEADSTFRTGEASIDEPTRPDRPLRGG